MSKPTDGRRRQTVGGIRRERGVGVGSVVGGWVWGSLFIEATFVC